MANQQHHQLQNHHQHHNGQHPKAKTRDSDCCSVNFVKYVLHIFNVVFFSSGVAVAGVALWTLLFKHDFTSLLSTTSYYVGTVALLVAGILAIFGGILGCCGVWKEQRCLILMYTFLLLVVFLLEAVVGGFSYLYETQVEMELEETLNATFLQNYAVDETKTIAIDKMQHQYLCCGAIRFEDWSSSVWLKTPSQAPLRPTNGRRVPDSCCISFTEGCGKSDHPSNIPYTGCIYKLSTDVRDHLLILGAVGLGVCIVQIFGMVLACCLYIKLKGVDD